MRLLRTRPRDPHNNIVQIRVYRDLAEASDWLNQLFKVEIEHFTSTLNDNKHNRKNESANSFTTQSCMDPRAEILSADMSIV